MKEFDDKGLIARQARQLIVKRRSFGKLSVTDASGYRDREPTKLMVAQLLGPSGPLSD